MAFYQLFIIGKSHSCSLIVIHVEIFARRKKENWSPSDHILITYGNFLCIFYSDIEQYIAFILNIFNFNSLWDYLNLLYLIALISINHTQVLGNTVVVGGSYIYMYFRLFTHCFWCTFGVHFCDWLWTVSLHCYLSRFRVWILCPG